MNTLRRFLHRCLALVRPGRADRDLNREITAHLQILEDQFVEKGMSREEAHYAARRAFGGVEQAKELQRDERSFRWLSGWPMDLKLGARMLVKSPGLTVVAVFALSIAIGGGVAYLDFVNGLFHPSLPVPDGDRLVGVQNWDASLDRADSQSLHDFFRWRESARSLEHLGAHLAIRRNLITADGRSEPVEGVEISASAFRLVPTPPLLGRPLMSEDERPTAPPVVLIGEHLWRARFGSDPGIVGRSVQLGSQSHTVIGVMPERFGFPVNDVLWVPLRLRAADVPRGEGPEVRVFGRLAPGAEIDAAQAELAAITSQSAAAAPGSNQYLRPQVKPYVESLVAANSEDQLQMTILYSLNLFFVGLLAVCGANVATLVFARTATREGEITVRTALGASRGRIVAQLFAEALVLTTVAALVGLAAAAFGIRSLTDWVQAQGGRLPFWWTPTLSTGTLLYAAALAVFAAAIIGILPALKATNADMQSRLRAAASGGSSMKFGRVWTGVMVTQIALTVVFLLSVVSLSWTASAAQHAGTQFVFSPHEYLTARLELDAVAGSDAGTGFLRTYREIERRVEADPVIAGVTYSTRLPGVGHDEFWVELEGIEPATRPRDGPLWVKSNMVAQDFFDTFDAAVVRGRTFTPTEVEQNRPVVIVDETFARLILGGRNPIGVRVRHQQTSDDGEPGPWLEIVGVVRDIGAKADKTTEDAELYRPHAPAGPSPVNLVVRVKGDAQGWTERVRSLAAVQPAVRLYDVRSLDEVYRSQGLAYDLLARGLAVVTLVALVLATAGVYSLMSFTLARRRREIGIRMALGAAPRQIVRDIFSRGFRQIGLGVLAGSLPGAALVAFGAPEIARGGGLMVALIATLCVGLLIVIIAAFACAPPARRALRIDPMLALRTDG